ncbi:MAG: 4Fe-4S binding protein [Candidatus Promineifilaceae bacterium]|nr:4Fe-4S binding protein [Candidatus Promineifilaceae bacterium]
MDVYERLARFLDTLPAGFPRTADDADLRLLRHLFSPDEAELAMTLTLLPEPARVVARRAKQPVDEIAPKLEEMARKGLILSYHRPKAAPEYQAVHAVVGFWEFQVGRMDQELIDVAEAYIAQIEPEFWRNSAQLRTIPVGESISADLEVMAYEQAEALVRDQRQIRVNPCICRQEKEMVGEGCGKPVEACLSFGDAVDYYERLGVGRRIDQEEALAILTQAEEAGLILQPSLSQKAGFICCCCGDCCGVLTVAKRHPRPADILVSTFFAKVDPELCGACGDCEFRCQMEAIAVKEDYAVVDLARCIGCGLCVSGCPDEAVQLVRKPPEEQPAIPRNSLSLYTDMLQRRGVADKGDMLRWVVRSRVDRLLSRF